MKPALQSWEKIKMTLNQERNLYRDWGLFFTQKQQLDFAVDYYDKSLSMGADDKALFYRSQCKRDITQTQGALEDSLAAAKINARSAAINLEICDAIYELNRFEDCKIELHDNARQYGANKAVAFLNRLITVDENLNDSVGETLGPFLLQIEKHFDTLREAVEREKYVETRPLWKIMKELEKCDVQSIIDKQEIILSPREIARRERCYKIFHQYYFNKAWQDILFLRSLCGNPNLLLQQSKASTPVLQQLTKTKYEITKKFSKMLHARSPLYNERMRRCPNKNICNKHREENLNRLQYETRRNMLIILRTVHQLRSNGELEKLSQYVEEAMGDYVVLKTHRVMPAKFEFINEVYNTIALAHADRFIVPKDILYSKQDDRMLVLLRARRDKLKEVSQFVFGDRSTYTEPGAIDQTLIANKKFLNRLEKRMLFAKYPIEKCYLFHEIANAHMKQNRHEECCLVARKAIEECKHCNSNIYHFLNIFLIFKSYAVLKKIERAGEALEEALDVAKRLKNQQLTEFVETCKLINDESIQLKRKTASMDTVRRRKSHTSATVSVSSNITF